MSYRIEVAPEFARRLKKLSKRYKSIKQDYEDFLHSFVLEHNNAESCWHHCQQDSTLSLLYMSSANRTLQNSLVISYSAFVCCSVSVASCCSVWMFSSVATGVSVVRCLSIALFPIDGLSNFRPSENQVNQW